MSVVFGGVTVVVSVVSVASVETVASDELASVVIILVVSVEVASVELAEESGGIFMSVEESPPALPTEAVPPPLVSPEELCVPHAPREFVHAPLLMNTQYASPVV